VLACPPLRSSHRRAHARTRLLRDDVHVHVLFRAFDAKFHRAVGFGEQGVIGADADIDAGAILRPTLPNEDVAREHIFSTKLLHAKALGMRIAAVTSTTASFLVCHLTNLLQTLIDEL
jgi:hypothetical protein